MSDVKKIKAFVQEVLGCGCSEEVFKIIEETTREYNGIRYSRINIGNRLLVYVFRTWDKHLIFDAMAELVTLGVKERDLHGFNRFRLVYAVPGPEVARSLVEKAFRLLKADERTYIHVVDETDVEF